MTYTFKLARRLAVSRDLVVLTALMLLVACNDESTAPDSGSSHSISAAVQISPRLVTIETGQRVQLRGHMRTWRGDLVSIPLIWDATGGQISPEGVFLSSSTGTFKVTGRGRGRTDTSTVKVVRPAKDLVRIEVTPDPTTLDAGATQAFTATGYLKDGSTTAIGVNWSATGGEIDPAGLYTAGSTGGSFRVIASNTDATLADTSAVTVSQPASTPTLVSLIVSPTSTSLTSGDSKQFKAYGRTSDGDSVAVTASFTATGGNISSTGLYTAGQTSGTYRVIASSDGIADTAAVSIASTGRGLAAGFWNYPVDSYCNTMGVTSSSRVFATSNLLNNLQQARKCKVRLVLIPARRFLTTTGTNQSPFSLDSAKAFTDRMARVLTPDTLRKYEPYIIGFNLADDYNSTTQWGGTTVSPSQIQAWASYVRQKIPGLRIGIRVEPTWATSGVAAIIDYAWAQYHMKKGDPQTYFDKQVGVAKSLGLALAMGVNVEDCSGPGTAPCTPSQIRTFMGMAATYPQNCALLGWTYSSTTLSQSGMLDAWKYVLDLAAQHPEVPCRHL